MNDLFNILILCGGRGKRMGTDLKKIPKTIDKTLGMIITENFDIPEILIAVSSCVFFILKKNQIPDNRITNGKKLFSILGTNRNDKKIGILMLTLKSLKKFISSNKFITRPKQKKIKIALITILANSLERYLFITKDLIIKFSLNSHI